MYRITEQTKTQMQTGIFSSANIYVTDFGQLTLTNKNINTNLALNKPYTKTQNATFVSGAADTNNRMFTDGNRNNWFRYFTTSGEEIVVDLGSIQKIGGTMFFTGMSSGAPTPSYVEVLGSVNGVDFVSLGYEGTGTNGVQSFVSSFASESYRYVKFNLIRTTPYSITVGEGEVYSGQEYSETREKIYDISHLGILRTNNVYWMEDTPLGTSVKVEASFSHDGGVTWEPRYSLSNGGTFQQPLGLDLSNTHLKIRTTLSTNNINVPVFSNLTLLFDNEVKTDENNIVISRSFVSPNIIHPNMTSATTPTPYVITSFNNYNISAFPPWKAFDGVVGTVNAESWIYGGTGWITIDLGEDNNKPIAKYAIHRINTASGALDWTLEGSVDNTTWNILDQVVGVNYTNNQVSRVIDSNISNRKIAYRYYRLNITRSVSNSSNALVELQLFELADGNGYQIRSSLKVPHRISFHSKIRIPPHNKATGKIVVTPLSKFAISSKVVIKKPHDLRSRINIPVSNRASGVIDIVRPPTTTVELAPVKDAFVRESIPKLNYGTEQDLFTGFNTNYNERYRSFLGFDISTIPDNSLIKSAHLKLYHEASSSEVQRVELFELESDWTERGITWDNQPSPTSKVMEMDVGNVGRYLYFNLTELVTNWYEGSKDNNGILIKAQNELDLFYKRFYSRESRYFPLLVVEYVDKIIYSFGRDELRINKIQVKQLKSSDTPSKLNVKQVWFDSIINSRLKVKKMGYLDSHLSIKNPNLLSNITVKRADRYDVHSKLTVRVKSDKYIITSIRISRPFQSGTIKVARNSQYAIASKIKIIGSTTVGLRSKLIVTKDNIKGKISVIHTSKLVSKINVIASREHFLKGNIVIKRSSQLEIPSRVKVFYMANLKSKISVHSGFLKSRIKVPYRANLDVTSKIKIRVRSARDLKSKIRIHDSFENDWGYVYML
ncbi:DNRLRE domain-containing protein [Paenibacillus massiliensis]|uniref:DNRLRE domain-containing protein n=1 Tax=Paenibacillus massiliensis TaxID=225917 RepID=UPI000426DDFE|nr:DNRLRE domain-containing protein [Paenibacillus massiliensis]